MKARARSHAGSVGIPFLSLVDTLFGAFAAVLATAIVIVIMNRTRVPPDLPAAQPAFTVIATSDDLAACPLANIDLGFKVTQGEVPKGDPRTIGIRYGLASEISRVASGIKPQQPDMTAWYFAQTTPDGSIAPEHCPQAPDCLRAELAVVTAKNGEFQFSPDIRAWGGRQCDLGKVKIAFGMGTYSSLAGMRDPVPKTEVKPITIEVKGSTQ